MKILQCRVQLYYSTSLCIPNLIVLVRNSRLVRLRVLRKTWSLKKTDNVGSVQIVRHKQCPYILGIYYNVYIYSIVLWRTQPFCQWFTTVSSYHWWCTDLQNTYIYLYYIIFIMHRQINIYTVQSLKNNINILYNIYNIIHKVC